MFEKDLLEREKHNLKSPLSSFTSVLNTLRHNLENKELSNSIIKKLEERSTFLLKEIDRIFDGLSKDAKDN